MERQSMLISLALAGALGGALVACGADEAAPTPPTTPPPSTTSTPTGSGGGAAEAPLTGPDYDGDHSLPGDPVAGETVYRTNCIACHAADGRGNGGITGADLARDPRRLAKNNDALLRSIREGVSASPAMPAHRDILTDQQMRDALSYVRATFGGTTP